MNNEFDKKYGFKKDSVVKDFHKKRRMFAIVDNDLRIAKKNTIDSHADWFSKEGWIDEKSDLEMDKTIRGFVDDEGVYFYAGYDFHTSEEVEAKFRKYLADLAKVLDIDKNINVYAGMIKQEKAGKFPPQKCIGKIGEIIKKLNYKR
ncbi:MAG: hypothetical protein WA064_00810 [Candidatus Moraniibacteriota bacterium]